MSEWVPVAREDEIRPGAAKVVEIGDVPVAVVRAKDGNLYALQNVCPHRGGPVGEGPVVEHTITCPWHGWSFDLDSGRNTRNPAASVRTFPVDVKDGVVRVRAEPE